MSGPSGHPADWSPGTSEMARLQTARRIAVLTGAGVSAESGIATFRDAGGLWSGSRPEDVATPRAYANDPARVWDWYAQRRAEMAAARPNPGHLALAAMEAAVPVFTLITQNIDGLHQAAGSRRVLELHGSIHRARCTGDGATTRAWGPGSPPVCTACGAHLRPDVVWFGEQLAADVLEAAWSAAAQADVFISVGTSALVEPAASLPVVAVRARALLVEINPEATPLTPWADLVLPGPAGDWLPLLLAAVWPDHARRLAP